LVTVVRHPAACVLFLFRVQTLIAYLGQGVLSESPCFLFDDVIAQSLIDPAFRGDNGRPPAKAVGEEFCTALLDQNAAQNDIVVADGHVQSGQACFGMQVVDIRTHPKRLPDSFDIVAIGGTQKGGV
jgi:hypothetical protein